MAAKASEKAKAKPKETAQKSKASAPKVAKKRATSAATAKPEEPSPVVGYMCWWDLYHCFGRLEELKSALEAVGLGDAMPPPLSAGQVLHQVFSRKKHNLGVEFKAAGTNGDWKIYRPVRFVRGSDDQNMLSVDPSVMAGIGLHKGTGEVKLQDETCEIGQAVLAEYKALEGCFLGRQVGQFLKQVLEVQLRASKLRRKGAFYFVPDHEVQKDKGIVRSGLPVGASSHKILTGIQTVVQGIGDCEFYLERVLRGSDTARAAARSSMRTLDSEYRDLLADVESFVTQLEAGDLVNPRAFAARVDSARGLRRRADMYKELLDERGLRLQAASGIVADLLSRTATAATDVRALSKASGSEQASALAGELRGKLASEARESLKQALETCEPLEAQEDEDQED